MTDGSKDDDKVYVEVCTKVGENGNIRIVDRGE